MKPSPVAGHPVPGSHLDLLDRPLPGALTTEMGDGRLQCTVVWYERDGDDVLLSTMREFQKARNLLRRPHASLLVLEPAVNGRWVEVRGFVTEVFDDPVDRLDAFARRYTGVAPYFGAVVPAELAAIEHPVTFRLSPSTVCTGPRMLPKPPTLEHAGRMDPGRPPTCAGEPALPTSHLDLLDRPVLAILATRMGSAPPQSQPVWFERDGNHILVNTTWQRRKGRNLVDDPRATVLVIDPDDSGRWVEIRGDAELTNVGALEQLDRLTRRYTEARHYYGDIYPLERQAMEERLLVRLHPRRINCDAIH